ncbi:MAG: NAD(+)--dinitrogen-reductase ADP-D-ribosyltransferase [Rhodocyclaceae bacterium]
MKRKHSDNEHDVGDTACDKTPTICRADDIPPELARHTYPPEARLPINRCNLPAEALASLAYQLAPVPLELDGVAPLHQGLFARLAHCDGPRTRAELFHAHMRAHFLLDDPPAAGWHAEARLDRSRLDYLRLLRGWLFDPDGREAAVLKGWVESRFGLLTTHHRGPLGDPDSPSRSTFDHERAAGLYATGALEAQLDLLYAFAQHELARRHPGCRHLRLYRGYSGQGGGPLPSNSDTPPGHLLLRANNLSAFAADRERADEFGDHVIACAVPLPKILAFSGLFPHALQGETEYLVIGGMMLGERVV